MLLDLPASRWRPHGEMPSGAYRAASPTVPAVTAIRLIVIDHQPVIREGVTAILTESPDLVVVGEADTAIAALECAGAVRPDVCLTDVRLPDMSGIALCAELRLLHPSIRTVVLSEQGDALTVDQAFHAGARGFVLKSSEPSVLLGTIRLVARGEVVLDPRLARGEASEDDKIPKGPFGLTHQELRILEQLPLGLTNKGIAAALDISEDTVKTHLKRILFKLRAHDRAEAVAIAHREGLL